MLRESQDEVSRDSAAIIRIAGTIQGVGFRPFVYRLALRHNLTGWVRNAGDGVVVHVEGKAAAVDAFAKGIDTGAPDAARITSVLLEPTTCGGFTAFQIDESDRGAEPTVPISPDLAVCGECLHEMRNPADRRHGYAYINCTNCGPRYSIIRELPYDRPFTTMGAWRMCEDCAAEYVDVRNRRFHAQPTACPVCGPTYRLCTPNREHTTESGAAIAEAAALLRRGGLLGVKGIGGYHIACDAGNPEAVAALRQRKFRKEKPFALMVRRVAVAESIIEMSPEARDLLSSVSRPIVLAPARPAPAGTVSRVAPEVAPDVAPGIDEFGVMLPYAPLHVLLFEAGAPEVLVMTSANRSNEPIAYEDDDAFDRLGGLADALLVGERPIARRVDDSVARVGVFGPALIRRSRGYAPGAVADLPSQRPILALGADLKNTITIVVDGNAFVSQHIGDLDQYGSHTAFRETIADLFRMYDIHREDLIVAHDAHPQYASTMEALEIGSSCIRVQHHEAHVASVLAERGVLGHRVLGIALDGTGYGTDGEIWGGEFFAGSARSGFDRVAHLREAWLPGGDAAARHPVQAAAGFLAEMGEDFDFGSAPFFFPRRYESAVELLSREVRVFRTTSVGRLFDTAAALLGFTRSITYEGQAAIHLEQLGRKSSSEQVYPFPDLDFEPLLSAVIADRRRGRAVEEIARAFHLGLGNGLADKAVELCRLHDLSTIVLSGGVFQNQLLLGAFARAIGNRLEIWTNSAVPCNDGGVSLGQAAIAAARASE